MTDKTERRDEEEEPEGGEKTENGARSKTLNSTNDSTSTIPILSSNDDEEVEGNTLDDIVVEDLKLLASKRAMVSSITQGNSNSNTSPASPGVAQKTVQPVFTGTLQNTPQWQGPIVPQGETVWRTKEASRLEALQAKYQKLCADNKVSFYKELKEGQLFKATHEVHYRVYKGELDGTHKGNRGATHVTQFSDWVWEKVNVGDILMYILQEVDEDDEITPRWIITDSTTGEARVRDLYIASFKLTPIDLLDDLHSEGEEKKARVGHGDQ